MKGWVSSVITWRWSENDETYDVLDHTKSPVKKKVDKFQRDLAATKKGEARQLEVCIVCALTRLHKNHGEWLKMDILPL